MTLTEKMSIFVITDQCHFELQYWRAQDIRCNSKLQLFLRYFQLNMKLLRNFYNLHLLKISLTVRNRSGAFVFTRWKQSQKSGTLTTTGQRIFWQYAIIAHLLLASATQLKPETSTINFSLNLNGISNFQCKL